MHDCTYCGDSFEDERPYLEHLRDRHGDELGAIDRKRVQRLEESGGRPPGATIAVVGGLLIVVAAAVYLLVFAGGNGGGDAKSLSQNGDAALLEDVESFESRGTGHVGAGTDVEYARMPPLSGDHWGETRRAGFYREAQPLEALVHNLEHGHVVVYYDPAEITPEAEQSLRAYTNRYSDGWSSVLVVPNPQAEPEATYVVTAWRHELTMNTFDEDRFVAFLSEYLGRGPENPVR